MDDRIIRYGIKVDFHIHSVGSKYKDHSKVKEVTLENIGILIEWYKYVCNNRSG